VFKKGEMVMDEEKEGERPALPLHSPATAPRKCQLSFQLYHVSWVYTWGVVVRRTARRR
jgi:hypothetical protein